MLYSCTDVATVGVKGLIISERWLGCVVSLQVRLLKRGLELLEADGRIVYSTCSLNPVEDEAVICTVLTQMNGLCYLSIGL